MLVYASVLAIRSSLMAGSTGSGAAFIDWELFSAISSVASSSLSLHREDLSLFPFTCDLQTRPAAAVEGSAGAAEKSSGHVQKSSRLARINCILSIMYFEDFSAARVEGKEGKTYM